MLVVFLLLAALVTLQSVVASPVHSRFDYAIKESHNVPPKWSHVGNPHPFHLLKLQIGLRPNNFGLLEQHLHQGEPAIGASAEFHRY